ncbi:MAG: DNA topoisomerase I [Candidatus Thermoplasmatota archaeon]|nr:DNA topoisomerase I [Candidatus Thermoplasmatota archaeon]MCL5793699.1 DNA topoisomerase I [Candidatus Thermoplasmatota archaeon]
MALRVIIAEKADAARRIAYFLSDGKSKAKRSRGLNYIEFGEDEKTIVIPLSGHIIEHDFPDSLKKWSMDTLENLLESDLVRVVKNRSAYDTLKEYGDRSDSIVIATDYDREGELIGVEALEIILGPTARENLGEKVKRAKFSALTGDEIRKAFQEPIGVDYFLADAAGAREEIDLLWGAILTRFFSLATNRLGKNFISLGRVQTPTLALIVNRENEIRSFRPEPFWKLEATFHKKIDFVGQYEGGIFKDKEQAVQVLNRANSETGITEDYSVGEERIPKPPPFNTTEFLREVSRLGIAPARAMRIAESLYTRGYISYPRTDNTVYQRSISLKGVLQKLKHSAFSSEVDLVLSQEKISPSRGRTEATDHPPIYPVTAAKPGELRGEFEKIYELVVRRFLATLYKEGKKEVRNAVISVNGIKFISHGATVKDPGWLSLYPYRKIKEEILPDLEVGEKVPVSKIALIEDSTKPPPRYDLANLLKTMEELMLGTKSTRHDIIEKLQSRGFIEGNPVRPTPLGSGLISSVVEVNGRIADPEMTATLESDMDAIATGEKTKSAVTDESKRMLDQVLGEFRRNQDAIKETIHKKMNEGEAIGDCPLDGGKIILIRSRELVRLKCTTPGCRVDFIMKAGGKIELAGKQCPVCSLPQLKIIRRGQSPEIRCPDPKCSFNTDRNEVGKCPSDGGQLVIRQSRNGKRFLGCSHYPDCHVTYPLPQMGNVKPTGETCSFCGSPILSILRGKSRWVFCPKMDCEFNKRKKGVKKREDKPT